MTTIITSSTPQQIKRFSLEEESMYNIETYMGRLKHFARVTDVRMMFLSGKKIEEYKRKIDKFKNNPGEFNLADRRENEELWQARYALKSAVNAETGKILPTPLRMCSFVTVNIPIVFGLICLPPTFKNIIFFNFLNQTYNAVVNYANGSGTEDSIRYTAVSYCLAVFSSIGTGLLLKKKFDKKQSLSVLQEAMVRIFPSMMAGFLNLFFMRSDYIAKGINIKDEKGNVLGTSKICGAKAVLEGALTRVILPIPLLANHFFIKAVSKLRLPKRIHTAVEITSCTLALGLGLPSSIAVFKENVKVTTDILEADLRNKLKQRGVEYVYYNKGL